MNVSGINEMTNNIQGGKGNREGHQVAPGYFRTTREVLYRIISRFEFIYIAHQSKGGLSEDSSSGNNYPRFRYKHFLRKDKPTKMIHRELIVGCFFCPPADTNVHRCTPGWAGRRI